MKKLLSSLIIILTVLLMLWAVAGWYFGKKAEQEFKVFLQKNSQLVGRRLLHTELLSYKKTPSGALAKLGIHSDYPVLTGPLDDLILKVTLLNGPFFITRSGVSFGSSRWVLGLESKSGLALTDSFPHGVPSATIRVDFDQKAHYVARLKNTFADTLMTGIFDLKTQDNRGAITLKNVVLGASPNIVSADNVNISYQHQKAITAQYKPGTAALQVSALKIQHEKLSTPLVLSVKANSNISSKFLLNTSDNNASQNEHALSGFITSKIRTVSGGDFPVETVSISLHFNGLPEAAFIAFSEAGDELDNLHQQAQWVLEELGEVPEGQDQIWQLYDRIEQSSAAFSKKMAKQIQAGGEPFMQVKASTLNFSKGSDEDEKDGGGASSSLKGDIKLSNKNLKLGSWLSLLDGEAQVALDKKLFEVVRAFIPINKSNFTLLLKDNKVLLHF